VKTYQKYAEATSANHVQKVFQTLEMSSSIQKRTCSNEKAFYRCFPFYFKAEKNSNPAKKFKELLSLCF